MKIRFIFVAVLTLIFVSSFVLAKDIPLYSSASRLNFTDWYVSHGWVNGDHQSCEWRRNAVDMRGFKLQLMLSDKGGDKRTYGCGEIQSIARFGYGRYEARMRTAVGSGLNTAFFTYIGPGLGEEEHDEIDFEFLGAHPGTVDVTHWANGVQSKVERVDLGFDPSKGFHDYAFEWREDGIVWFVDGEKVHEKSVDAMPRNDMKIYFSLWSGARGIDDWLGRFKYTGPKRAEVEWVKFTPFEEVK